MTTQELRAQVAELETAAAADKAGITKADLDQMRATVRKQLEAEYEPLKTENEGLKTRVRTLLLDNVVKASMGANGVRADRVDTLFKLTDDRFDLTDDDKPMLKGAPGKDVGKYIAEELEQEYPELYAASGSSGGSASKSVSSGGGGRVKTIARDDGPGFLANVDKIASGEVKVAPE